MIDKGMVLRYLRAYKQSGGDSLTAKRKSGAKKHELQFYKDAVFTLLHSPPHDHGVNRTSWRMEDLMRLLREQGIFICKDIIRKIIKDAGFRFRKAKRVLTSTDPEYRQKLVEVTRILSELSVSQRFFSIDEYGPFSVKMQGGRALTGPGEERIVPQWQRSKGSLTLAERNQFFIDNPKRAGNKIWGKERVPPVFNLSNNCKDPNYR